MTEPQQQWTETIESRHSLFDLKLGEVWRYKDLVYMFVKRDFISGFKQTVLGPVWFFINPVFTTIVYLIVFGNIANLSTDGAPKILFYLAGVTLWNYFSACLTGTSNVFVSNAGIFGKVYFPRLVMPLTIVISNLMRFGVQMALFIAVFLYYYFNGSFRFGNRNDFFGADDKIPRHTDAAGLWDQSFYVRNAGNLPTFGFAAKTESDRVL